MAMTVYLKIGRAKIIHSLSLFHRLLRSAKFDFAKLGISMGIRGRVGNASPVKVAKLFPKRP